ncbi:MAG: flagellar hook-length control protein FliK [Deltaproteobacteria bacterium]|nr:flagellar hook-length control protein FliK [Deltaproteobacteria bacterium]MBW2015412.1 flagellar hook-length control protein FliK [Deltaproteobacteria bacterium]
MQQVAQMMMSLAKTGGDKPAGMRKTPQEIGNGLFKTFLTRGGESLFSEKGARSVVGDGGKRGARGSDPLKMLEDILKYVGMPTSQFRLPPGVTPQLIHFLEKRGLSREKISRLLQSATDADGMIQMDRLLVGLGKGLERQGDAVPELIVEMDRVPEVESLLFKLGFGVEDVKKMMENSVREGEGLSLSRLSRELGGRIPGFSSEKEIAAFLSEQGIKSRPRVLGDSLGLEVEKKIKAFSDVTPDELQQKVKSEIAGILRRKGVPPEEVKAFLERLSIKTHSGNSRAEDPINAAPRGKGASEAEAMNLLSQVVIKPRSDQRPGGWQKRIMEILRQENLAGDFGQPVETPEDEGHVLRSAIAEWIKGGKAGQMISDFQGERVPWTAGRPILQGKAETHGGRTKGRTTGVKDFIEVRNAAGNDLQGSREINGIREGGTLNSSRETGGLPHPLPRIVEKIGLMIRGGEQRGSIRISPPELGRLEVELVIKQGHVHANLSTENPMVKEIIEANLHHLRQQLTEQGFIVEKFEVMVGLGDRQERERNDWMAGGSGRRRRSFGQTGEEPALSPVIQDTVVSEDGQVSVHV